MLFNEGALDRAIRIVVGIGLAYLAWTRWPSGATFASAGAATITVAIVAAIALVTGLVGWCPLYTVFGWSTSRKIAS